ncbi:phospholipase D-like domain-containing protein, partial [Anaerosalibacter bizertensis]|nr:phospholipase D-like domain-containing protein [Anaerosalibacter bizertensis]
KNIIKTLNYALGAYIIYIIIFGGIVLSFYKHNTSNYLETHPVERFWGEKTGQDRVVLVEDRYNSGIARIDFIENAKETLDISYYAIDNGISSDIFLGCILNAANRGVKVRLLLDGSLQNIIEMKEAKYTIFQHPNIELKFYDTSGFFRPWSWNNRLHDKYIIADNQIAMIGGRNIGDRYFAKERKNGDIVNDRDVVIINTDSQNTSNSAIYQMREYFNYVWNHKYSKCPV